MPVWTVTGLTLITIGTPASASPRAASSKDAAPIAKPVIRVIEAAHPVHYRLPASPLHARVSLLRLAPDRRIERGQLSEEPLVADPQALSVRNALRDRLARRGGALSGGIEWRLDGRHSELGLGGGLRRVVDALVDR